jgi:hypothetical protein
MKSTVALELARELRSRATVLSYYQGSRPGGAARRHEARGTRAGLELEGGAIAKPESERPARVPSAAKAANSRSLLPVHYDRIPERHVL